MNITFRQLRLFMALAETGSVSAAARMVHVTQPTASMGLKEITDAIGVPLYEVVARKIHLTQMGHELAKTARAISGEWEAFEQQVDGVKGLTRGKLKVAVVSTAKYFIPRILGIFCAKYPQIDIALEILNRDGVVNRLEENLDDLYIMSQPPVHLDIEDEVFMPNPLVLVASKAHPFANKKNIEIALLKGDKFIFREKGSGTRMTADAHFKRLKFKPDVRLELGSNEAIKQAVIGGLGVAVLSQYSLGDKADQEEVAILKCKEFPIESSWHIVSPKGKKLSPIATIFKKHLSEQSKEWVKA
ncbi:DNA-binding transcriptional LysR family regulator [Polynucleobacter sphagniphilus]|jgi:DNA-binding transcriptional LysR family regulator|uniref:DNA-binding transcriptional LysR family regulator n=1 Tax=Polynucleobacter sphagniphilus TaxID=1743169 RepID=A0AA43MAL3_9BURK|nr:LysR family transcriptional regulator [Polynucleobacter sphagniphilus]MDH6154513.1 DNA-binding transcriptional LysR family regulator [Polynucleobacter sphagniphilus]MDH6241512.1 DNA-binding transcriptional LysR family regulator [Polynucleobacter sphagniphilus]MDH6249363.1 DNA-binding transcriptional LysR family regulator [Polynucleobacter sphagniphilus]MDH6300685.1 DNA-binding transcriptional LysR family regulator [Polynucleobacter sphagniphilus]MDH6302943.1 DNA-binding transcriptional LysR